METVSLPSVGTLLAVLTPLFAVPLTVIVFYLRSLREQQSSWHAEATRRLESNESGLGSLRGLLDDARRDFVTKEEWLRESMYARSLMESMRERTLRLEARLVTRDRIESASATRDRAENSSKVGGERESR